MCKKSTFYDHFSLYNTILDHVDFDLEKSLKYILQDFCLSPIVKVRNFTPFLSVNEGNKIPPFVVDIIRNYAHIMQCKSNKQIFY